VPGRRSKACSVTRGNDDSRYLLQVSAQRDVPYHVGFWQRIGRITDHRRDLTAIVGIMGDVHGKPISTIRKKEQPLARKGKGPSKETWYQTGFAPQITRFVQPSSF
jgi:hypothetical protein